jgi:hypothetical protein
MISTDTLGCSQRQGLEKLRAEFDHFQASKSAAKKEPGGH